MSAQKFKQIIKKSKKILIIQADNPDGDSLSSALALEDIFEELEKDVTMYCRVNMPHHLRHLAGWDRVVDDFPNDFDATILVDASTKTLLDKMLTSTITKKLSEKPFIVLDHHDSEPDIEFASELIIDKDAVATGEVIYNIADEMEWPLSHEAKEFIASSIMYDSLGLVSEGTNPGSIRIIADLVEDGVSLAKLDNARRMMMSKSLEITHYKGDLIKRVETHVKGQLAYVHIPWEEIAKYSDQYNPSMLVIEDMRLIEGVKIAAATKEYPDGKITCKIRTNYDVPIAAQVAEKFGGGGHTYAAGFKVHDKSLEDVKRDLHTYVREALSETAQ